MATLLEMFRTLASFSPASTTDAARTSGATGSPRGGPPYDLRNAPWDEYVEWAVGQGLAPLAAYNLEYRLAGGNAPDWARDRLLGIYQGLLNDNVMKLVNFKRSVDGLEGRRVAMIGAAAFAENLYPHVAFRPVAEIRLLLRPADLQAMAGFLKNNEFKPAPDPEGEALKPELVVSDTRTAILLHGALVGDAKEDAGLLDRAEPVKVYGPSMFRLSREDALLVQVLLGAKAGFDVPFIEWVDLRELVLGAPDVAAILSRAKAWRLERALYTAMQVLTRLFPDAAQAAAKLTPDLALPVRKLLDVSVVDPVSVVGRAKTSNLGETLRTLLASS